VKSNQFIQNNAHGRAMESNGKILRRKKKNTWLVRNYVCRSEMRLIPRTMATTELLLVGHAWSVLLVKKCCGQGRGGILT
jgi:hypothetical protein